MRKEIYSAIISGIFITAAAAIGIIPPLITYIDRKNEENAAEVQTLLELAEEYYLDKNYEGVIQVYSHSKLKDNTEALLNLGVMYANGFYYKVDEEQAIYYFRQALDKGETYHSIQYLLYLLDYEDMEEAIELVKIGCEKNNKWCEKILQSLYEKSELQCNGSYLLDFSQKTEEEKRKILENLYYLYDQIPYEQCKKYKYVAEVDKFGNQTLRAECLEKEEKYIPVFIRDYIGIDEITMVFN